MSEHNDHYSKAREDYELLQYCWDNGHSDFLDRAERLSNYYRNKQWDESAAAALRLRGVPTLVIPKFFSVMNALSGKQLASRSDIRFAPQKDATREEARVMDKVYLHVAQRNTLDSLESVVFDRGALFGRGFYDIRTEYDDNYMGHVKIRARRSQQVVLEPELESYDPMDWTQIFHVPWMNLLDVEYTYGPDVAKELKNQPTPSFLTWEDRTRSDMLGGYGLRQLGLDGDGHKYVKAYRIVDRQYRVIKQKECFIDMETGDFSEIPETFDRNKISSILQQVPSLTTDRRKVKTVRWRVSVNDLVIHEEDSPYKSFSLVGYFPYFIDNEPQGHMENLLDMQDLTNKSMSKQLEILTTTANSGYKIKTNSVKNMTIQEIEMRGAESGIVFEMDDINHMEKIQPNQVPTGFDRFSQIVDGLYDKASGISNQARGFAREDVAAKAIAQNEAANDINFAKMFDNLYTSKSFLARSILDCVQSSYTETRLLTITGGSLNQNVEQVPINQPTPEGQLLNDVTRGTYSLTVVPSKARSTLEESEFDALVTMRRDLGIAIPDSVMIESSPLPNKAEVLQAMTKDSNDQQELANQQATELHQAQMQTQQAETQYKLANAKLSEARANKAQTEANDGGRMQQQTDAARLDLEQQRDEAKQELERLKLRQKELSDRGDRAMQLTQMGHDRRLALAGPKKESSNG